MIRYAIGIDPGTKTGYAVWDRKRKVFLDVGSGRALDILIIIKDLEDKVGSDQMQLFVEDPGNKFFGQSSVARAQGAGSIKRDFKIWKEACDVYGWVFNAVPANRDLTKMKAGPFKALTGYPHRTNGHGRDAAMLVFGR